MLTKSHLTLGQKISYAIVVLISIVMVFPLLLTISTSLKTMEEIQSSHFSLIPEVFQWNNYIKAMQHGDWLQYFYNSFFITSVTVVISLLFNSMAGYSLARLNYPGKKILFFLILIGLMVPEQVTLVPMFKMMNNFPLAGGNNLFGQGGHGLVNTRFGIIIPFLAAPFGIFLCRQFFQSFPKAIDDAATIDGASSWRIFFQIYLPSSGPLLAALGILKTVNTWNHDIE